MTSFQPDSGWVVLSSIEQTIKSKIERIGTPLKDWDVKIYRGILTGYNPAFIVNGETRNNLVKASPKSEEIIRPILLGRNLKRFSFDWEGLWIINAHNGVKNKGIKPIDVKKDYPAIFEYLKQFQPQLEKRLDQGDHWTNLRNCAYLEDFNKPKVAWGNLALQTQFCFIQNDFIINAPSPFFTTNNLYLIAILNSKLGDYYIKQLGVSRSGGYFEFKPMFVEKLPIPKISEQEQIPFRELVQDITAKKAKGEPTQRIEDKINKMVFKLYDLSDEEINTISQSH